MKKKTKTRSIEDAIIEKYPDVTIHEIRHDKFGTRVLATVPARDEFDKDHIVEWTDKGYATECYIDGRDFREVSWDEDEQKPIYVHTKMLLHNDTFDIEDEGIKQNTYQSRKMQVIKVFNRPHP